MKGDFYQPHPLFPLPLKKGKGKILEIGTLVPLKLLGRIISSDGCSLSITSLLTVLCKECLRRAKPLFINLPPLPKHKAFARSVSDEAISNINKMIASPSARNDISDRRRGG